MLELNKRIITSFFLLMLLFLMYSYTYILIISLIIIASITWIEFNGLISKIFFKNNLKSKILKFLSKTFFLIYLLLLVLIILIIKSDRPEFQIFIIYALLVSITTDIGGLLFGKVFKGKKLTKISPKKTISGSIGSFIISLILIPLFTQFFPDHKIITMTVATLLISLVSQLGDLFISFLKRKAKVKDTSNILPGHGGFLDRIDGIILSIPFGILIFNYL